MPEPTTPTEWLPILAAKLDEQQQGLQKLRNYARGKANLPEMGKHLRASWEAFQAKARTDYGGIAVRSLRNRIRTNGVRIGQTSTHPALATLRKIELDNGLERQIADAIRDYLETQYGYLAIRVGTNGSVVVRREKPEDFYALADQERPWRARASIKVWRDAVARRDYAQVVSARSTDPTLFDSQTFTRSAQTGGGSWVTQASTTDWEPIAEPSVSSSDARTVILDRADDGALLAPHLDVIDRINLGKLQRLVTTAIQAYRQRGLQPKDGTAGLPDTDENGNTIDWAAALSPAPGALWELPPGIDVWESQNTDITPMLNGEKQDARDFAAATGTPISVLIPEGGNQSAEGAANAKEQQIAQARDDIARVRPAIELALVYALAAAGVILGEGEELEQLFAPPEHVSLTERFAAAVQGKAAGLSGRTIKRDILGMTPDQIAQDEADAGADMLAAALLGVGSGSTAQATPASAQGELTEA